MSIILNRHFPILTRGVNDRVAVKSKSDHRQRSQEDAVRRLTQGHAGRCRVCDILRGTRGRHPFLKGYRHTAGPRNDPRVTRTDSSARARNYRERCCTFSFESLKTWIEAGLENGLSQVLELR